MSAAGDLVPLRSKERLRCLDCHVADSCYFGDIMVARLARLSPCGLGGSTYLLCLLVVDVGRIF